MDDQNVQKLASYKILFSLNFENPQNMFIKSANFFYVLQCIKKRKCSQLKEKMGVKPSKLNSPKK